MIVAAFIFLFPATVILGQAARTHPRPMKREGLAWCVFIICVLASFGLSCAAAFRS